MNDQNQTDSSEPVTRCGFVAIVGRPNAGKSTLLNQLVQQRISITSRKPQTTRHAICGIDTENGVQAIYVDTPGLQAETPRMMNRMLNRSARDALADVDLILLMLEAGRWTEADQMALETVRDVGSKCFAVLNKVDLLQNRDKVLPVMADISARHEFSEIVPLSALQGYNTDHLREMVRKVLPVGPFLFPEDQVTDRSERFLATEMIREQLVRRYGDELPYQSAVAIESYKEDANMLHIHAVIYVERDSQKKIIVGHGGIHLRDTGIEARKRLEEFFSRRVNLRLWVKVKDSWSDDARLLRSLGYGDEQS